MRNRWIKSLALLTTLGAAVVLILPNTRNSILDFVRARGSPSQTRLLHWTRLLHDPDSAKRRAAIEQIGELGPDAAEAIPALVEIARDDNISVRSWAIQQGLGRIGPAAIPALAAFANDRSVHTVVVLALGDMGPGAVDAVPVLIEKLHDSSGWTRTMACVSLTKIGTGARPAVPELRSALLDDDSRVRTEAWLALKAIAPELIGSDLDREKPPPFPVDHPAPLKSTEKNAREFDGFDRLRVEFEGIKHDRVPGLLYLPKDNRPGRRFGARRHPAVLLQYGSGGHKDVDYIVALGRQFVAHGFIVLTIDAPARGERAPKAKKADKPAGEDFLAGLRQYLGDYSRAVDFLESRREVDPTQIVYAGISWGAMTGVPFVAYDQRIQAMVSIVGGGNVFARGQADLSEKTAQLLSRLDPARAVSRIAPRPVLFINATRDQLVPKASAEALHKAAGKNAKVVWLETDHYFQGMDQAKVGEDVIRFLERALRPETQRTPKKP
jgi:dienelactone hydrolase